MMLVLLLLLAGCTGKKNKTRNRPLIDSLSSVFYDILGDDPVRALAFVDSLEQEGIYSEPLANCRRAQVYSEKYQPRVSEMYVLRALKDDQLKKEDPNKYYFAHNLLINAAHNMGNLERELTYATKALKEAKADTSKEAKTYAPDFLTLIGNSQFSLEHTDEGNESYEHAYKMYEEILADAKSFTWFYPAFMLTIDAVNDNVGKDSLLRAKSWLPRMQQSYDKLVKTADIPNYVKDECKAEMEGSMARYYAKAGQLKEADAHYQALLKTDYANTIAGRKTSSVYLRYVERWQDLLKAVNVSDSFYTANDSYQTIDYLANILGTKFDAQMRLGQRDAALQTANRLVNLLDTVEEQTRKDDAAELAVVYETQEKEQKIAEQKAELLRQRTVATGIAVGLLLLFLIIYAINSRRHAQRLMEKNAQLEVANARAEESSRMKSSFIRQISHEIRTPLNILSGFTQVVTTEGVELDEATRKDINRQMIENTDRITGLVNKMLELSDANSKTAIERNDQVSPVEIAALAVENSGIAQAPHLNFDMQLSPAAEGVMLTTNQQSAIRALTLILDNARKFTKSAEAYRQNNAADERKQASLHVEADNDTVRFIVDDTGIGIPSSESEHIFEEFVQLDEYYDGTGIGLTVARSLARRLGGDITLDTSATNVTRFIMTLPQ